jgi:P-type Mg2+ transporter
VLVKRLVAIESLVTQTLVVYAIRTRRVPFLRSRPSLPLVFSTLGAVAVGAYLPVSPAAPRPRLRRTRRRPVRSDHRPRVVYLAIVDTVKRAVFRTVSRDRA